MLRAGAALDPIGVLAGIVGAALMSAGTVLTKRWGRPEGVGPLALTGWQLTAGGLLLVPLALIIEGAPPALDARNIGGYLYLGVIGTAAAYGIWFRGLSRLPATSVAFLTLLSPLSAAVIGWVALGQSLSPLQVAGIAIALGGTLMGQIGAGKQQAAQAPRKGGNDVVAQDVPEHQEVAAEDREAAERAGREYGATVGEGPL
ncbi:EamA family transporter [Nocardia sp. GAS34]|uniref:EamA family transporter n=1 Tax=unclassified Nocardia TaxID=2637762 RepID=UPI003D2201A7